MKSVSDQIGRNVTLASLPQRIISLVPSQTELLCDLGLEDRLVGITKFCVHPEHLKRQKALIGGTKQFNFDLIDRLQPDLIIANKEENPKPAVERLAEKYPVWVSDVFDLNSALQMITALGEITGTFDKASMINREISTGFAELGEKIEETRRQTCLYLIWKDPYMAAGSDTFISDIMKHAGYDNMLETWGEKGKRYPRISISEIVSLSPAYIFFSSEPYPFRENHLVKLREIVSSSCTLVDGEAFSWYGSRMIHALPYLISLSEKVKTNAAD